MMAWTLMLTTVHLPMQLQLRTTIATAIYFGDPGLWVRLSWVPRLMIVYC